MRFTPVGCASALVGSARFLFQLHAQVAGARRTFAGLIVFDDQSSGGGDVAQRAVVDHPVAVDVDEVEDLVLVDRLGVDAGDGGEAVVGGRDFADQHVALGGITR